MGRGELLVAFNHLTSGFRSPAGDIIPPPKMFQDSIHLRPLDNRVNLFAD